MPPEKQSDVASTFLPIREAPAPRPPTLIGRTGKVPQCSPIRQTSVRNSENQLLVSGFARAHECLHFAMFMSTYMAAATAGKIPAAGLKSREQGRIVRSVALSAQAEADGRLCIPSSPPVPLCRVDCDPRC